MEIAERCGSPGHLWGELDDTGSIFLNSWQTFVRSQNTPEFKAEFNTVLDMLRSDERCGCVLKNRTTMRAYCRSHPQGGFRNGFEYAFRADTKDYSYLIRCVPDDDDNIHAHVYPYRRDLFERHMRQAEKGIRFITPDGREKFRLLDGDMVRITTGSGLGRDRMVRYIDDCHSEIGGSDYHVREFAEWMEASGSKIIPLRASLPDQCFSVAPDADQLIMIVKGEMGHHRVGAVPEGVTTREGADSANEALGVSKVQEAAMLAGSMFGWDAPAADPKNYNEQGRGSPVATAVCESTQQRRPSRQARPQFIKPKPHDRGDVR